jgi:hypothetical protein
MRTVLLVMTGVLALAEAAAVCLFAALSLSGDDLGIAKGLALRLATPLLFLTVPAVALLRRGQRLWPALLALAAAAAQWLAWLTA